MPDYHLYDSIHGGKEYEETSIGYLTRGCFRKCGFCVNQKYDHVFRASELEEFYDPTRKYIALLDDNFFGFSGWRGDLNKLIATGKPFKFKQGLDERLLTEEKWDMLISAKYWGDYTFAFDRIQDYDLITSKIRMMRSKTDIEYIKFYVLCGYDSTDIVDVMNTFKRISALRQYRMLPYIMRMQNKNEKPYKNSEWRYIYTLLARWCNQPAYCKKETLWQYATITDMKGKKNETVYVRELRRIQSEYPESSKYIHQKWGEGV